MNKQEVLALCQDFEPVKVDGKTACKFLKDELCHKPKSSRFMCSVVEALYRKKEKNHVSHSQVGSFMACPRKWMLHYRVKGFTAEPIAALALGSAFHENIANIMHDRPWHMDPEPALNSGVKWEQWETLRAVTEYWEANLDNLARERETETEVPFTIPIPGSEKVVTGRIDGSNQKRKFLIERKYSDSHNYDNQTLHRQLGIYFVANPWARMVYVVRTSKPSLKLGKTETRSDFAKRVRADVLKRAKASTLVEVKPYLREDFDAGSVMTELAVVCKLMDVCDEHKCYPGKWDAFACPTCEYRAVCKNTIGNY